MKLFLVLPFERALAKKTTIWSLDVQEDFTWLSKVPYVCISNNIKQVFLVLLLENILSQYLDMFWVMEW
jgi:hypothetical protein